MTLRDFFLGGTALRMAILAAGLIYCARQRADAATFASLIGSIVVLVLLPFSREAATLAGLPVTYLIVDRLTHGVDVARDRDRARALLEDQHAMNEHLVAELERLHTHH